MSEEIPQWAQLLISKVDGMGEKIDGMEKSINTINIRLDGIRGSLDGVRTLLNSTCDRVSAIEINLTDLTNRIVVLEER